MDALSLVPTMRWHQRVWYSMDYSLGYRSHPLRHYDKVAKLRCWMSGCNRLHATSIARLLPFARRLVVPSRTVGPQLKDLGVAGQRTIAVDPVVEDPPRAADRDDFSVQ